MKYALEEVSSVKKTLSVEVPEEVVTKEIAHAYSHLSKTVRLPGFRKGKAPLTLLEKKFHEEIKDDVLKKLVPDYYQKAVRESGIEPVEFPRFEKIEMEKNAPLSFKAVVEVRPKFDLKEYTGLPLKIKKLRVTEAGVERSLESLREMHAQLEPRPEDHAIVDKDFVTVDFEGFIEGQPMEGGKAEGYPVEIGSKTLIPGFEDRLLGRKKGEPIEFSLTLPKEIKPEKNAGKEALFKVTVREIKKKILPDLDHELAKDFGLDSMDQLKEKLKEELVRRYSQERDAALKNEIIKSLNQTHEFELPASLVNRELVRIIRGLKEEDLKKEKRVDLEAIKKKYEPLARERVKGSLILHAVSLKENLQATPQEVEDEILEIARETRMKPDEVKKTIVESEGSLAGVEARLVENKALSFILSKAKIEEEEKHT